MTLSKLKYILIDKISTVETTNSISLIEKENIYGKNVLYKIKLNCNSRIYNILKLDKPRKHFCNYIKNSNDKYHKFCDYAILFLDTHKLKVILIELKSTNVNNKKCIYKFKSSENALKYLLNQLKIDNNIEEIKISKKIIFCIDYKNKKVLKQCTYKKNQTKSNNTKIKDETSGLYDYCMIEECHNNDEFNLSKYYN